MSMPWHNVDDFLNEVCSHIKYKKAHKYIKEELKNHIEDRIKDYIDQGYDEESAISKAIENMGNPTDLGKELNKQHKPYLGWALYTVNTAIVILSVLIVFMIGFQIYSTFAPLKDSPKKQDIAYSIKVNKKNKIDARTVTIEKLVVDKKGIVYIYYHDFNRPFSNVNAMNPFDVYDDKGNLYSPEYINESNFLGSRYMIKLDNLNSNASKIILDYDYFNRKMSFEIPVKDGDNL